jgi:hypothetical protein
VDAGGQPHAGPGPPPGRIAARTRARLSGEPADPADPAGVPARPGRPAGQEGPALASRPGPAAGPGSPATLTASWRTARCTTAAGRRAAARPRDRTDQDPAAAGAGRGHRRPRLRRGGRGRRSGRPRREEGCHPPQGQAARREHTCGFRKLARWRTGSEARISRLRHRCGRNRSLPGGLPGATAWCGPGVPARSTVKIAALAGARTTAAAAAARPAAPAVTKAARPAPPTGTARDP